MLITTLVVSFCKDGRGSVYIKLCFLVDAGRIHGVRTDNSTFETVEEFKYLGTTLTNQNSIAEEVKSRLRSGNAFGAESFVFQDAVKKFKY